MKSKNSTNRAVALSGVTKTFDGSLACSDISLSINHGEFFTLLGPSGCGKTTILRLIAGFIKPDSGSIYLGEKDITLLPPEKRKIGMVFQNYALFPFMSVYENIEFGLSLNTKDKGKRAAKVSHYLEMTGLSNLSGRNVSELSGGEQQRVALARSIAIEPDVLLMDEPLSNLDARLRDNLRNEIRTLQKKLGITTIFVTHDQREALTMSDRIAVFDRGKCLQVGTPDEIYNNPTDAFTARFVGETNFFEIRETPEGSLLGDLPLITDRKGIKNILIRPQDVILEREKPDTENSFEAVIEAVQFNGMYIEYTVKAGGLIFRSVSLNRRGVLDFKPDEKVYLSFEKESLKFPD